MKQNPEEIVSILREEIEHYDTKTQRDESGTVLEIGDGIATVYGLTGALYGELVEFDTGTRGMVMNLETNCVGCVLLGTEDGLREGSTVRRTGRAADIPVGDAMVGRTVDALGCPIDGRAPLRPVRPARWNGRPPAWSPVSPLPSPFRLVSWPLIPWFPSAGASVS